MRWLAFSILAYVTLAVQVGLGSFIAWHGAVPNLMLIAAIFIAINTPRETGLLACFILGLLQDLTRISPVGLHAFTYGVIAMAIMSVQQVVYRDHPLTHLVMALAGGLIGLVVLAIWDRIYPWLHDMKHWGHSLSIGVELLAVLYTAAAAPLVIRLLQRMKRVFGFRATRANVMGRS